MSARALDEWEQKVEKELSDLHALWVVYAAALFDEAKRLRAENRRETITKAVSIETFIEHIEMLFIEARVELEHEVDDRLQGDEVNMAIAAKRVNEALDTLRTYAKEWKAYVDKLLGREGENNG
jgi:uncharacterized Fe-S cluster-containing MiaB family protein